MKKLDVGGERYIRRVFLLLFSFFLFFLLQAHAVERDMDRRKG